MTTSEVRVQGTNDSSSVSKLSQSGCGYFKDEFMRCFVKKPCRRSALINRCYYARACAISHCLKTAITTCQERNGKLQVVSLGAGFDTNYFQLQQRNLLRNVLYIEIDYPDVLKRKISLAKTAGCLHTDGEFIENSDVIYRSENYICIGFDLRQCGNKLVNTLKSAGANLEVPTIVLSEVVLAYLKHRESSKVIKWFGETFVNTFLVIFEQITPFDSFGMQMISHFQDIGSSLLTIKDRPTLDDHFKRYQQYGFNNYSGLDLNTFYHNFVDAFERQRVTRLEMFDEYESWHRACLHYFIACATNSNEAFLQSLSKTILQTEKKIPALVSLIEINSNEQDVKYVPEYSTSDKVIRRFGHCSCAFSLPESSDNYIASFGGFGTPSDNVKTSHRRLKELCILNVTKNKIFKFDLNFQYTMWSQIVHHNNKLVLFGGRSSPHKCTNEIKELTICLNEDELSCKFDDVKIANEHTPTPRFRHSCVKVGSEMFLIGGKGDDEIFGDVWKLNLDNYVWEECVVNNNDIFDPRHSHSSCPWQRNNFEKSIIISGGLNEFEEAHNSIFLLSINKSNAVNINRLNLTSNFPARFSHSSHVIDDKLYIVGGVVMSGQIFDNISVIDLNTSSWDRSIELNVSDPRQRILLHGHTTELVQNEQENSLYVIGGGDNCFSFGTWLNFTPLVLPIKP